jgi:Spy/CpxP family protein refolding chaperone
MDSTENTKRNRSTKRLWWLALVIPVVLAGGFGAVRAYAFAGDMGMAAFGSGSPEEHRAFMQRHLEKMLDLVKATDSQRTAIKAIGERLFAEMQPIHQEHARLRDDLKTALAAPTVDATAVENLRVQATALMDRGSQAITKALVDASNVLTADQRQTLIKHIGEGHGHRHHGF